MAVGSERTDLSAPVARSHEGDGTGVQLRPAVKALVVDDRHVLLVEETHPDGASFWTLPGGGLQPGETLADALRREVTEELGADLAIRAPVGCAPYRHRSAPGVVSVYVVFEAALLDVPIPNVAEGIRGCTWARPSSPPDALLPAFADRLASLVAAAEGSVPPRDAEQ